jgi:predicted enzyme related to lactoylglutathione lyase
MPHPVVHFEIVSKDPQTLNAFYREAFGWNVAAQPVPGANEVPDYYMVMPDGDMPPKAGINGGFGGATDEYGGHVTFYIAVEDVAATLDAVEKLGGSRMMGPSQVPNGPIIGLFKDPQGHTIGLAQM